MKIALIGNTDLAIYNYRYELLRRLLDDGHRVTVISPNGQYVPEMKAMGCDFYEVAIDRHGTNPLKDLKVIKEFAEKNGIDPAWAWDMIKRANYEAAVERGLIDRKEVIKF